jgi:hypothetical protein
MEDLTGRYYAALVPSSGNAGNTTASNPELALTAPGSVGILPVPERLDVLPQPRYTNATPIPVGHPGQQTPVKASNTGGTSPAWTMADVMYRPNGDWTEV